jgi:4'-phosphopantetheinyl transferase
MDRAVHVWLIQADPPDDATARLREAALDDDERRRAATMAVDLYRRRFVSAHGAARLILAAHLGIAPTDVVWRRGPHGKPSLVGQSVQVNLSHSDEWVLIAATTVGSVGVDVQRVNERVDVLRLAERYFPPAEAAHVAAAGPDAERAARFFALWTRKEACLKVSGGRLIEGMRVPVLGAGPDHGTDPVRVHDPAGSLPGPYVVRDLPAPAGFHAAVAVEGSETFTFSTAPSPRLH